MAGRVAEQGLINYLCPSALLATAPINSIASMLGCVPTNTGERLDSSIDIMAGN
jgi:hypothetical protein